MLISSNVLSIFLDIIIEVDSILIHYNKLNVRFILLLINNIHILAMKIQY